MSAAPAPRYLLPPRPRPAEWPLAGACAGLILGSAELLVALASGVGLPPLLALLMLGVDAVLAGLLSGAIGLGVQATGARPSHSALVGALVGVLLWISFSAPLWQTWGHGAPSLASLALLILGSAAIAALGFAVARLADRAERAGVPASAALVWVATSLLLAGGARLAYDGPTRAPGSLAGLVLAGVVLAAAAALAVDLTRRRGSRAQMGFGRMLVLLAVASAGVAAAPVIATWLLFDRDLPAIAPGPPNILAIAIDRVPDAEGSLGSIAYLASTGRRFELARALRTNPQEWLVAGAAAVPMAASLLRSGYATGAVVRDRRFARDTGADDVDARPGGLGQLDGSASWMSAAPLLRGAGEALVLSLGLGASERTPAQLGDEARRWLERWRGTRHSVPFFLLVDFRGPPAHAPALDRAIGGLLDALDRLEAGRTTLVVALVDPGSAGEPLQVVLRAPPIWGEPGGGASARLRPGELGEAVLELTARDASTQRAAR